MKLLVIARHYNPDYPKAIGGVIVSSENLLKYLRKNGIEFDSVDTNKKRYKNHAIAYVSIILAIIKKIRYCQHVAMNLRGTEIIAIAPVVILLSIVFGKSVSLRVFGGNFDVLYKSNWFYKKIIDFVLARSTTVFLQTRSLVNSYREKCNVLWLPTCRFDESSEITCKTLNRDYSGKFVFIAQIKKTKGVSVILEALNKLEGIHVDFYGPLEEYSENDIDTKKSTYKGIVNQADVIETLSQYDYLLFPTFHEGEGYPGVIIESYAAGTPVITTKWRSIPELIDEGESGLLIKPDDVNSLVTEINNINSENYKLMRKLARHKFGQFNCDDVYCDYIKTLV